MFRRQPNPRSDDIDGALAAAELERAAHRGFVTRAAQQLLLEVSEMGSFAPWRASRKGAAQPLLQAQGPPRFVHSQYPTLSVPCSDTRRLSCALRSAERVTAARSLGEQSGKAAGASWQVWQLPSGCAQPDSIPYGLSRAGPQSFGCAAASGSWPADAAGGGVAPLGAELGAEDTAPGGGRSCALRTGQASPSPLEQPASKRIASPRTTPRLNEPFVPITLTISVELEVIGCLTNGSGQSLVVTLLGTAQLLEVRSQQ